MSEWVSVVEQLPPIGADVIVYRKDSGIAYRKMFYDGSGWYDDNGVENAGYDDPPTYWIKMQSLPPPPDWDEQIEEAMR